MPKDICGFWGYLITFPGSSSFVAFGRKKILPDGFLNAEGNMAESLTFIVIKYMLHASVHSITDLHVSFR